MYFLGLAIHIWLDSVVIQQNIQFLFNLYLNIN